MNTHFRPPFRPAPRNQLTPNLARVIEAIGFLIAQAQARSIDVTQYDLVKSLFIADRVHLNKFGRPITFDNYVAMRHGPVPSLAYDLIKQNEGVMAKLGVASLPWRKLSAEDLGRGCFRYTDATTQNRGEVLSDSDLEALSDSLTTVTGLTFSQVRRLTHEDPAYKEAWEQVGEAQSIMMSLGMLFDVPDFEAAAEISKFSKLQEENASLEDAEFESYFAKLGSRDL